jgi:hypothetical protein
LLKLGLIKNLLKKRTIWANNYSDKIMGNNLNSSTNNCEQEQATGAQILDNTPDPNSPTSQYTMTIGSQKNAITSLAFAGQIIPKVEFGNTLNQQPSQVRGPITDKVIY